MNEALETVRGALGDAPAWLVGGAVRDRLLGRATADLDLAVEGDPGGVAQALARAVRGPAFELSGEFGAWRVIGPRRLWQVDVNPVRGGSLQADLALRDFTVNAMAEPLAGGPLVDPSGGERDLRDGVLRMVAPRAFADDPLRVLRLARIAVELGLRADAPTLAAAREHAPGLAGVAQERVFAELRRVVGAPDASAGLRLADETGALAVVLPELGALAGVEQTVYHHRDALGHTLEVLDRAVVLDLRPAEVLGEELGPRVAALLREPLADELTRGGALRWAALLHDIAKPFTAVPSPKGGFGFPGHDREGATLARDILARLRASEQLRRHVAELTRHHLRPGFLVAHQPLGGRLLHGYLKATDPVGADVVLLSVADRLATRGRKHEEAIAKHLDVVGELLGPALDWHEHGPPAPLVRGDDLARELGLAPGPLLGELLAELAAAQYAGEIATREEAVSLARAAAPPPR